MKQILHDLCPPFIKRWYQRRSSGKRWRGDFRTWGAAAAECSGYQQASILERVKQAALRVQSGEGAYERDSIVFAKQDYSWPLLSFLLHVAALNRGTLHVLDFGGSLGSTYVQHRKWFDPLPKVRWCVVEQEHFVTCGRKYFEDERLRFYPSTAACLAVEHPNVALFSSVLQYLPDPWGVLDEIMDARINHLLIHRTGFTRTNRERITVQWVSPEIYAATYPCRFFSRASLLAHLLERYELIASTETEIPALDASTPFADFFGLFFRRREHGAHSNGTYHNNAGSL